MNRPHVAFLDQLRGLAILLVVIFHSLVPAFGWNQFAWNGLVRSPEMPEGAQFVLPAIYGWSGVAIFFVVSGFCIHLSFQHSKVWRDFFVRRFFRLYPPYLAALLLFALLVPGRRLDFHTFGGWMQMGTHLTLTHNFHPKSLYEIVGAFWSIATEVQLYALYPALLWLTAKWGWRRGFMAVAAVELVFRIGGAWWAPPNEEISKWVAGWPFTYWLSWSLGVAVADAHLRGGRLPFAGWSLGALLAVFVVSSLTKPTAVFSFFFASLLTAAAISRVLAGHELPVRLPRIVTTHLERAGLWSYSVYLLHQPIVEAVPAILRRVLPGMHFAPLAIFTICCASWFVILPISRLWYRYLELPSIAAGQQIVRRWPGRRGT